MKLGSRVKQLTQEKGYTLARLAKEAKVPLSSLHAWTTGRRSVNPEQVRAVAAVLQVSVHSLMFGEADPFESPGEEILKELFSGDVRLSVHKIERKRG